MTLYDILVTLAIDSFSLAALVAMGVTGEWLGARERRRM